MRRFNRLERPLCIRMDARRSSASARVLDLWFKIIAGLETGTCWTQVETGPGLQFGPSRGIFCSSGLKQPRFLGTDKPFLRHVP